MEPESQTFQPFKKKRVFRLVPAAVHGPQTFGVSGNCEYLTYPNSGDPFSLGL